MSNACITEKNAVLWHFSLQISFNAKLTFLARAHWPLIVSKVNHQSINKDDLWINSSLSIWGRKKRESLVLLLKPFDIGHPGRQLCGRGSAALVKFPYPAHMLEGLCLLSTYYVPGALPSIPHVCLHPFIHCALLSPHCSWAAGAHWFMGAVPSCRRTFPFQSRGEGPSCSTKPDWRSLWRSGKCQPERPPSSCTPLLYRGCVDRDLAPRAICIWWHRGRQE